MNIRFAVISLLIIIVLTGCGVKTSGETGTEIVSANEAISLLKKDNVILVDARSAMDYKKVHLINAVNVSRADIVINSPYPNMLCTPEQFEKAMNKNGISNRSILVVYDANKNMDSARLWWTLKIYGHNKVKVVSGGMDALIKAGITTTTTVPDVAKGSFEAETLNSEMLALKKEIKNQINTPEENIVIIDTRSLEEYNEGTIPGSILLNYIGNNFQDQTYRPVSQIQIRYLEEDIDYNDTIIMFCKTSIRGAQTYLALYNAGYRNLKLYDGAWVEWSASPANPVFKPETKVYQIDSSDNS